VYGFRPSWGLVPLDAGDDTFMGTLVTDGPMARTVEDLAHLLGVLAGPNPETPFGRAAENFTRKFNAPVKGKRIGWLGDWEGAYRTEPGILACCEAALEVFARLGAIVEPVQAPFPAQDLWQSWITLRAMLNAGSKQALYDDPAKRAMVKPETLWEIERGRGLTASAVYQASRTRSQWYATAARLFQRFDALALPSAQVWPFPAEWRHPKSINGHPLDTYHRWMEIVIPVSLAGLPCLGMPAGFGDNGLPMGIQLFGQTGADSDILGLGHAYHQATDWPSNRPPKL
ncbi:MAG: amidase family protein, partial [Albidovulum sp.]